MLNRNNLTLSALSNRLNLGTRSLVLTTGVNNGTALRIRHTHHDVMRNHMEQESVTAIPVGVYAIPPMSGPATAAAAARFKKACVDSWKPDAAAAWLVPTQAATWQGWPSSQPAGGQGLGSGPRSSSRSRLSTAEARIVEARRRPSRSLEAIETTDAAWASRAKVARQAARAAVAE